MIDREKLERWANMETFEGVYITMRDLAEIARELLDNRAIVEALAAIPPFYVDQLGNESCGCCGTVVARHSHTPRCPYARAVALVGPAGEREEEKKS